MHACFCAEICKNKRIANKIAACCNQFFYPLPAPLPPPPYPQPPSSTTFDFVLQLRYVAASIVKQHASLSAGTARPCLRQQTSTTITLSFHCGDWKSSPSDLQLSASLIACAACRIVSLHVYLDSLLSILWTSRARWPARSAWRLFVLLGETGPIWPPASYRFGNDGGREKRGTLFVFLTQRVFIFKLIFTCKHKHNYSKSNSSML